MDFGCDHLDVFHELVSGTSPTFLNVGDLDLPNAEQEIGAGKHPRDFCLLLS